MGPHCCYSWRDISCYSALIECQQILSQQKLKSGLILVANVAGDQQELNLHDHASSAKLKREHFVKRDKTNARTLKNHFQLLIVCALVVLP